MERGFLKPGGTPEEDRGMSGEAWPAVRRESKKTEQGLNVWKQGAAKSLARGSLMPP